jgi:hypothetical protein
MLHKFTLIMKKLKSTLLIILFFTACNSDNPAKSDTENTGIQTESSDTTLYQTEKAQDTIESNIFLEKISNTLGNFGVTVSEWNKHLAQLAKDNVVNNLDKTSSTFYYYPHINSSSKKEFLSDRSYTDVYEADLTLGDNLFMKINGIFRFPINNDTFEVFSRDHFRLKEPVLVGIKFDYYFKQGNSLSSTIIPSDWIDHIIDLIKTNSTSFEYVAGDIITSFDNGYDYNSYYKSYLLSAHSPVGRAVDSFYGKSTNVPLYHEHNLNSQSKYTTLYKTDNYFSIINVTYTIEAELKSRFKNGSNLDCELISAGNERSYYYLTNIILSKKQCGINTSDFYSDSQNNYLERNNKQQQLIDKALNGK